MLPMSIFDILLLFGMNPNCPSVEYIPAVRFILPLHKQRVFKNKNKKFFFEASQEYF
jgi:hypothetical protein